MKRGSGFLWVFTVLALLAAVDIVVESMLAGSVMGWAAVCAAVLIALIVAFGRGFDSLVAAALATSIIGGLLVFQDFRIGSDVAADGLRFAGHSGDMLGAAFAIEMLAVAAFLLLVAARRVPIVLRIVGALAIVYAAVPLGFALAHGGGLAEAMTTNAPFFSEPSWLRGAYVGALVVLPVAAVSFAVAFLVTAGRRRFRVAARFAAAALACAISTQTAGIEALARRLSCRARTPSGGLRGIRSDRDGRVTRCGSDHYERRSRSDRHRPP